VCDGSWAHYVLPLSRKGVSLFLEREDGLRSASTVKELWDLVWKKEQWMSMIFKVAVYLIKNYNVEAMVLQLIAARFLEAKQNKDELS
jgi:hypothetical protein